MAENKKSFIAYVDWNFIFKKLSDEEAGKLAKMLFSYVSDENPTAPDRITELIFEPIKQELKRDIEKNSPENHWNWKGGISSENKLIRNSREIREWRILVFERDKWTCQNCGLKGGILNAHHKKPFSIFPKLRFDMDNGITLCKKCHINLHKIERLWL